MNRMARFFMASLTSMLFVFSMALAHEGKTGKPKLTKLRGEIVDLGCYLAHAGAGPDHKSCALKCINGGMPMGVLTADGTLYLLTMNHDNADPYNQAKTLAAQTVDIGGTVHERAGMKGIDVTSVRKVVVAPAPATGR